MNYKQKYFKHYGIGEQDIILCKVCGNIAVDLHHIIYKSRGGKDNIENLIPLCRLCHDKAHNEEITIDQLNKLRTN